MQSRSAEKSNATERSRLIQMFADVADLQSSLAATKGQISRALLLLRKSVKFNRRAWATLERARSKAAMSNGMIPSHKALTDSISEIAISKSQAMQNTSTSLAALQGVSLWTIVPRLFRSLHSLSEIYAHEGLFPEARYYSEQGQKIAEAVKADAFKSQSIAQLGCHFARSGDYGEGIRLLEQAQHITSSLQRDRHFAALQLRLASLHTSQGEWHAGESAAALCEYTLGALTSANSVEFLTHEVSLIQGLATQMSALNLQEDLPAPRLQTRQRVPAKRPGNKPILHSKPADPASKRVVAVEGSTLSRMRGDALRQRALIALSEHNPELASTLLAESAMHSQLIHDHISQEILAAHLRLRQGLERMVSDPVFGVLPESTVSHPSTRSVGGLSERSPQKPNDMAPPRNQPSKPSVRKLRQSRSPLPTNFIESLYQAQDGINKVCLSATTASTTVNMHSMTDIMGKTLMMLSAINPSKRCNSASPNFAVYMAGKVH